MQVPDTMGVGVYWAQARQKNAILLENIFLWITEYKMSYKRQLL